MKLLCTGLKSLNCTLETLRLSGCCVTKEGCSALVSALRSNPTHLRELDLSYNYLGESGVELLSVPRWRPETLRVEPSDPQWLIPGMEKYKCKLKLDPNTAANTLGVFGNNRKVMMMETEQLYRDHPDRFEEYCQVLCSTGLSGRHYCEVRRTGRLRIAVTYKGIRRKGSSVHCELGGYDKSWALECSHMGYSVCHKDKYHDLGHYPNSPTSGKEAVYVDFPAGSLSFFQVSPKKLTHLYTFKIKFTEPVYVGFWLMARASVTL